MSSYMICRFYCSFPDEYKDFPQTEANDGIGSSDSIIAENDLFRTAAQKMKSRIRTQCLHRCKRQCREPSSLQEVISLGLVLVQGSATAVTAMLSTLDIKTSSSIPNSFKEPAMPSSLRIFLTDRPEQ